MPGKRGALFVHTSKAQLALLICLLAAFSLIQIGPLFSLFSKAFLDKDGHFAGLRNYAEYFGGPSLSTSVRNTADVSLVTTVCSVLLGFAYAYGLTRTNMRGKAFFRYTALIPIFLPTVVHALGLVYIFGRQGILTGLGVETELYGRFGIILSEIIYTFPQAFLMFVVALEVADGRLYEAADSMGVSAPGKFFGITLPDIKYTVVNVFFVCFTLAFTDFGAPKVLGGGYNVLATDIYKQIAGQFDMNMGAVVGTLLLLPAVLSFAVGRIAGNRNASTINTKTTRLVIRENRLRDALFFVFCAFVSLCFLFLIAVLFMGALTEYYPYNMAPTLRHFSFNASVGGMGSYFNSLRMSLMTALFGTVFVFVYAYIMEKTEGFGPLRKYGRLLATLPLALPGMVIGVAFIFFFNARENPLHFIYGTIVILVLSNILHYFAVPFITASGSLKRLDREFESVSDSMNISRLRLFLRVSVPLSLSAVLEIFMYYFVNSMVTVSAVVFLYGAKFKIASIAITHMEEAGD
ncbi:MAG: putative 2-aminoethylphosphonate ABC transporter permease subunit, partial [Clostridiales Family XIII bacterium]|nr:putative 2-aminoethylphosphonate ABC transporter permease subunit [Clostridiales Family XIII bacterium]